MLVPPSATQIDAAAKRHLRESDPVMAGIISGVSDAVLLGAHRDRPRDHYGALVRSIVGQQLSVKAAATIYGRLTDLYDGKPPTPEQILAEDPERLRAVGLSYQKAGYLHSLAEHVESGELELHKFNKLPDEQIIEELTAVKGLGLWTAQMFLMFHLNRPDVLPTGDLGIKNAIKAAYRLRKDPTPERMTKIAKPWQPHRTLACRYLWRSLDNEPA